ncbi:MAG: DUF1573 domain-containing protein [Bacillota bacterium]|jgi:hypothetical protein
MTGLSKQYYFIVIGLQVCLLVLSLIPTAAAPPQPQLTLPQTTYDFGQVKGEEVLGYAFIIKNTGSGELEITSVTQSCRCIKTKLAKTVLAPGEITELIVRIDVKKKKGKFTDFIMVSSNDPERPIVRLKVTGVVEEK